MATSPEPLPNNVAVSLTLKKSELTVVGPTRSSTLAVLPSLTGKQQKVVVGDEEGTVTCFTAAKGNYSEVFRSEAPPNAREVTAIALEADNIYVAYGSAIHGLRKKGKQFYSLDTTSTEPVRTLAVTSAQGTTPARVWTAGEYTMNTYENGKDIMFYMAPDKINHFTVKYLDMASGSKDPHAIMACQDRFIRLLQNRTVTHTLGVDGTPLFVSMRENGGKSDAESKLMPSERQLLYGTDTGIVGQFYVESESNTLRRGILISDSRKKAAASHVNWGDIAGTGANDVIVGRDDGSVEVYSVNSSLLSEADANTQSPYSLSFSDSVSESVTSIATGHIFSSKRNDIVCATYSGKVLSFTRATPKVAVAEKPAMNVSVSNLFKPAATPAVSITPVQPTKIDEVKAEIEKLREKVAQAKQKYTKLSTENVAVKQQFKIKHTFQLLPDDAFYLLSVELPMAIDVVGLQSSVPVTLMDDFLRDRNTNASALESAPASDAPALNSVSAPVKDTSAVIVSRSPADPENGNELLATYRCQENTTRVEMKIRTIEGQYGPLNVYVIPRMAPKTCQRLQLAIKPLSLHERVHLPTVEEQLRTHPMNSLTVSGQFSLAEIHQWVAACLPDLNARVGDEEVVQQYYRSSFSGTILSAQYQKNKAVFLSDSVTTISIVKEVIGKEATARKTVIDMSIDCKEDSVVSVLQLLRSKMDQYFTIAKKMSLIPALKELVTQEGNSSFLSPELAAILASAPETEARSRAAPRHLDFLKGVITDLYVDKCKLRGRNHAERVPKLLEVLDSYDFDALLAVFREV